MIIDFTPLQPPEPEDRPPSFIPVGKYLSEIMSVEECLSHAGNRYLAWKLRPAMVHPGFRIVYITSLRLDSLQRLAELIEATTGIKPVGKIEFDPSRLVGDSVIASIGIEEYRNLRRNYVAKVETP